MKKWMMTAVLIMGITGLALAQKGNTSKKGNTPEQRAEKMTAAMDKQLHFTAVQRSKIYAFNLNKAKSRLRNGSGKADKTALKAARKAEHEKLLSYMTADQKKAFKEFRKNKKHGKAEGQKMKRPVAKVIKKA